MNAMTEIVPAVPDEVLKAIKAASVETRIYHVLMDTGVEYGHDEEAEEVQRVRMSKAVADLKRLAGIPA